MSNSAAQKLLGVTAAALIAAVSTLDATAASVAQKAISPDSNATVSSLTIPLAPVANGDAIAGCVSYGDTSGQTPQIAIADSNGNPVSVTDTAYDPLGTQSLATFSRLGVTGNPTSVIITFSPPASWTHGAVVEITGLPQGGILDAHAMQLQQGPAAPSSGALQPTGQGDFLYGCTAATTTQGATIGPGSGFALVNNGSGTPYTPLADEVATLAGTAPAAATFSTTASSDWITGALAFGVPVVPAPTATSYKTIFGSKQPAVPAASDSNAVTLGTQFQASVGGTIVGIRFYRGQSAAGGYRVALFDGAGNALATGSASGDTCAVPCWEAVTLPSPVTINANQTYVAAYWQSGGSYADDENALANAYSNPPLSALSNGGVYAYGGSLSFPTQVWNASNYYVDVEFQPSQTTPLTLSLTPSAPTVPYNATAGTLVSQLSTTGGDGNPVTYSLSGVSNNDFVIGGPNSDQVVVGPGGIAASEDGQTVNATVTANQP